ncbi:MULTISPECIES: CYTH domain-containing protein [Aphanothece]|uniref:CYTH domain-containing protein n=1 Tax=Aphanothece TaxID=1121 RepID=UPI0039846362
MGLEIERRFLVRGEGWRQHVGWRAHLEQAYLVGSRDGLTVRVRRSDRAQALQADGEPGGQAWLTLKAPAPGGRDGLVRQEFEYAIPLEDAAALMALAPHRLAKWRHGLELPGGDWVLDVFEGENAPLVLAEVELASAEQPVPLPSWCVHEVTGRPELSNAALAREPLSRWSVERRQSLLAWLGEADVTSDTI